MNNDIVDQVWFVIALCSSIETTSGGCRRGYEDSLVNSHVLYKHYYELKGVPVKWTCHNWNEVRRSGTLIMPII